MPRRRQEEGRAFVQGDGGQAEQKLFTHLTTNPTIEVDGKKELHDALKTKNDAEVRNVIAYILSR
jgi:cytochrome c